MTGGNDMRKSNEPGEPVWQVAFVKYTCSIMCKRAVKTVVDIRSLRMASKRQAIWGSAEKETMHCAKISNILMFSQTMYYIVFPFFIRNAEQWII